MLCIGKGTDRKINSTLAISTKRIQYKELVKQVGGLKIQEGNTKVEHRGDNHRAEDKRKEVSMFRT